MSFSKLPIRSRWTLGLCVIAWITISWIFVCIMVLTAREYAIDVGRRQCLKQSGLSHDLIRRKDIRHKTLEPSATKIVVTADVFATLYALAMAFYPALFSGLLWQSYGLTAPKETIRTVARAAGMGCSSHLGATLLLGAPPGSSLWEIVFEQLALWAVTSALVVGASRLLARRAAGAPLSAP